MLDWPDMSQERLSKSSPLAATEFDVTTTYDWGDLSDPYAIAEAIYSVRVDALKLEGVIRRAADLTDERELDDHFDDLAAIYRQVCLELGLPWPPPQFDSA